MPRSSDADGPPKSVAPGAGPRAGAVGLLDDLKSARQQLLATRHPAYYRVSGALIALLSEPRGSEAVLQSFERVWRTRQFPTFYERPLLILAALRADALEEGATHPLHEALAVDAPDPEVATTESVAASLSRSRLGVWSMLTTRRVQTNDTSRAIAWLWPAALAGCDQARRPLALFDVGAGAGLNLVADQLPSIWTDVGSHRPLPCASQINCVARVGFDSRPLSVQNADDVQWLRACIWPGETERLARFEASLQAMRSAGSRQAPPSIERLTASLVADRLEALSARLPDRTLLLAYQSLLRGYLEQSERESYKKEMLAFLARQPAGRAVWLELELDDARRRLPAVLMASLRVGEVVKSLQLGRMSQHPSEVEVDAAGVAELTRCLRTG